jgi:hypothetical protein
MFRETIVELGFILAAISEVKSCSAFIERTGLGLELQAASWFMVVAA